MEDSENTDGVRFGAIEKTVWESSEHSASDILFDDRVEFGMIADAVNRRSHNSHEFVAKTSTLRLVPSVCLDELGASGGMKKKARRQAPRLVNSS